MTQVATKKVLVVDDDAQICKSLVQFLKFEGFEAESAYDGQDGWEKVQAGNFDLMILDIMMPRMNGFEVLEAVRGSQEYQDLPVILLTAKSDSRDVMEAHRAGATSYLVKPFNLDDLADVIEQTLAQA